MVKQSIKLSRLVHLTRLGGEIGKKNHVYYRRNSTNCRTQNLIRSKMSHKRWGSLKKELLNICVADCTQKLHTKEVDIDKEVTSIFRVTRRWQTCRQLNAGFQFWKKVRFFPFFFFKKWSIQQEDSLLSVVWGHLKMKTTRKSQEKFMCKDHTPPL